MSKRPSLAGLARPKPGGAAPAEPPAAGGSAPRAATRGAGRGAGAPAAVAPPEVDMHAMTLRIPKATSRALKMRAIDEDRPVTDIVRDAIDAYLAKHRG